MGDSLIREYQEFVDDTLYNIWIYTEDLSEEELYHTFDLGNYYLNEVFITTEELFLAYELKELPEVQRKSLTESNRFVKATVMHELTHEYIHQIGVEMTQVDSIYVDRAYQDFFRIYSKINKPGVRFIEEGICEYVSGKMGEIIPPESVLIPESVSDLTEESKEYMIYYKYSSQYLSPFLDTTGLKRGIKILLHNPPPTSAEILAPELFFGRLVLPDR